MTKFDKEQFKRDILITKMHWGITYRELADKCNDSLWNIQKFITNTKNPNITVDRFLKICNGLDLDPIEYFYEEEEYGNL